MTDYYFPLHYHEPIEILLPQPKFQTYIKKIVRTVLYFSEVNEFFVNTQALPVHLLKKLVDDCVLVYFHKEDSKYVNVKWVKDNIEDEDDKDYFDGIIKETKKRMRR